MDHLTPRSNRRLDPRLDHRLDSVTRAVLRPPRSAGLVERPTQRREVEQRRRGHDTVAANKGWALPER